VVGTRVRFTTAFGRVLDRVVVAAVSVTTTGATPSGRSVVRGGDMKYVILMQVDPAVLEQLTEEQQRLIGEGHTAFLAKTKETGEFIATQALADPSQTKVIRARDGVPEVTDGPFAETKEFLGGFYLLDVDDEARALELAKMIPDAAIEGLALEVRPVMFSDLGDL
jgi:hypothetical protein